MWSEQRSPGAGPFTWHAPILRMDGQECPSYFGCGGVDCSEGALGVRVPPSGGSSPRVSTRGSREPNGNRRVHLVYMSPFPEQARGQLYSAEANHFGLPSRLSQCYTCLIGIRWVEQGFGPMSNYAQGIAL